MPTIIIWTEKKKEVHLNDRSRLIVNPPGETVGEVLEQEQRPAATRKTLKELAQGDENTEVLGTIVQAFEPKFFEVCPECGKRARPEGDKFVCPEHSAVTPDFSYVMNVVLDDLGFERYCCRRMFVSHLDLIEEVAPFSAALE